MDKQQLQRIKVLQAIAKAKASGKVYTRAKKREFIDVTSEHLPTKKNFQETIVHYIKTNTRK
jgi:hypothetical protein